jgi:uncharacterized protein YkwD
MYVEVYPLLSWYVHAGATGTAGMSKGDLESMFGLSHSLIQRIFVDATATCAKTTKISSLDYFSAWMTSIKLKTGELTVTEQIKLLETKRKQATPCTPSPCGAMTSCIAAVIAFATLASSAKAQFVALECLINRERTAKGLAPLQHNPQLFTAAQGHVQAAVQIKWWGPNKDPHKNPQTGSTADSRIKAGGLFAVEAHARRRSHTPALEVIQRVAPRAVVQI